MINRHLVFGFLLLATNGYAQQPAPHAVETRRPAAPADAKIEVGAAQSWEELLSRKTDGKIRVLFSKFTNDKLAQFAALRDLLESIPEYYDLISEIKVGLPTGISVDVNGKLVLNIDPKDFAAVQADFKLPDGKIARYRQFMEEVRAKLPGLKIKFGAFTGGSALAGFEGPTFAAFRKDAIAKIDEIQAPLTALKGNYSLTLFATAFKDSPTQLTESTTTGSPVERNLKLSLVSETPALKQSLADLVAKDSAARGAEEKLMKNLGVQRVDFSRSLDKASLERVTGLLAELKPALGKSPHAAKTSFQAGFPVIGQTIFLNEGAPVFLIPDQTSSATLKSWIETSDKAFDVLK